MQPLFKPPIAKQWHSKEEFARLPSIFLLHPFTQLAAGDADFHGVFCAVSEQIKPH